MNKLTNLLQRCDNCKSPAEADRLIVELQNMILELGLEPYLHIQGYEKNIEGMWNKKSSDGVSESVGTPKSNSPEAFAPPAAIDKSIVPTFVRLESAVITPPKWDPELLRDLRSGKRL